MRCYDCDGPARWKVTQEHVPEIDGEPQWDAEPDVVVEFWTCGVCVPHALSRDEEEVEA